MDKGPVMWPYRSLLLAALAALAPAPLARADMLPARSYSATPAASPTASDNNHFTGGVTLSPVASTAGSGSADVLSSNGAYSLTLSLHDAASGADGSVTFTGKLSGTFSLSSAALTNAFTGPTSQTLTLGSDVFTVSLGRYVPPGFPPSTPPGAISAHIDVVGGEAACRARRRPRSRPPCCCAASAGPAGSRRG
jgi:hypothetical protein